jgi:NADPH:quinone reductase-like Zn-dependent oxidoreductase
MTLSTAALEGSTSSPLVAAPTMRAVLHTRYGSPDVLVVGEVVRPVPRAGEVLVRVHAAGVSIGDHHIVSGKPYLVRLSPFGGMPAPKHRVPGAAFSGRVDAVGEGVTAFKPGDEVFGQAGSTAGAYGEYLALPATLLAHKPAGLSFEQAAAMPWGTTALQGLRDAGGVKPGQRVLINGASGAVGTWAVQLAKVLGAHVTAVCSTRNVALVKELGADEVLDYTQADFTAGGARFDVLFDLVANKSLAQCRAALVPGGRYVPCAGGSGDWLGPVGGMLWGLLSSLFTSKKYKAFIQALGQADLLVLKELVEAGKVRPVVEKVWPMDQVAAALEHVGAGHSRGLNVLRVSA